jgi:hypothetical protein
MRQGPAPVFEAAFTAGKAVLTTASGKLGEAWHSLCTRFYFPACRQARRSKWGPSDLLCQSGSLLSALVARRSANGATVTSGDVPAMSVFRKWQSWSLRPKSGRKAVSHASRARRHRSQALSAGPVIPLVSMSACVGGKLPQQRLIAEVVDSPVDPSRWRVRQLGPAGRVLSQIALPRKDSWAWNPYY